jgi:hypothetical protein
MATAIHNNCWNSTMGFAPSELLIGWEPPLSMQQQTESKNLTAEEYLLNIHWNRLLAIHALNRVAYKTQILPSTWKVGQTVWLEGKNLPLPYRTVKLAPRWHRPFRIDKIISPVAVHLILPTQWNIHPVFHTSLLMPFIETPSHRPNFTKPPSDLIDGEEEYEVEQICSHRRWGCNKMLQYLIKWKGYPESDNTWENANQVHVPILIKLYHRTAAPEPIKAWHAQLKHQHSPPLPLKASPHPTTPALTILCPSTDALLWSETRKNTVRSACNPYLAPQVQSLLTPTPHITQLESSAILMKPWSTLQVSTASNDNLPYAPLHLVPDPMPKCLPSAHKMPPTHHKWFTANHHQQGSHLSLHHLWRGVACIHPDGIFLISPYGML